MQRTADFWRRHRADGAVLLAVCLLALGIWLADCLSRRPGAVAVVTSPAGEQTVELDRDRRWSIAGRDGLTVTVQVENGRIRFASSDCPDRVCVHSGWLSTAGQTAACVPAGVSIRVTGDAPVDMIAG